MRDGIENRPDLRAHVIAYVALALALSGSAYAVQQNSVGDQALRPNSVGSSELEMNAVATENIRAGAVSPRTVAPDNCGYAGELLLVGLNYAPRGTLPANGDVLSTSSHNLLAALFGAQFGGDGLRTFGLSNPTPPSANLHYVVCERGTFPEQP